MATLMSTFFCFFSLIIDQNSRHCLLAGRFFAGRSSLLLEKHAFVKIANYLCFHFIAICFYYFEQLSYD